MFSVLRPFLFNLDPETAHDLAVKSLKFNPLPSKMFKVEDEEMLNIELLGKNFPNPIGLAAGFDKSVFCESVSVTTDSCGKIHFLICITTSIPSLYENSCGI